MNNFLYLNMTKPIFANTTHQIVVNDYLNLMLTFAKEAIITNWNLPK